jgi:hypothetical protein
MPGVQHIGEPAHVDFVILRVQAFVQDLYLHTH